MHHTIMTFRFTRMLRSSRGRLLLCGMLLCALLSLMVPVVAQPGGVAGQVVEMRLNLERIADTVFAPDERPDEWTANIDPQSPTVLTDIWFDTEQLAKAWFGPSERPDGWIGVTTTDPLLLARNLQHDIDMLASAIYGVDERPDNWFGAGVWQGCDRTEMNIMYVINATSALDGASLLALPTCDQRVQRSLSDFATARPQWASQTALGDLAAVRGDLERLADEILGVGTRPGGWLRNMDVTSASFDSDIQHDVALLASERLGGNVRPDDWRGQLASDRWRNAVDLRQDLELLATASYNAETRPFGWQGWQLARCDRDLYTLAWMMQRRYAETLFDLQTQIATASSTDIYCRAQNSVVNTTAENPPSLLQAEPTATPFADAVAAGFDVTRDDPRFLARSRNAFAYLNPSATLYVGTVPYDAVFRAWNRNYAGSTMMFVSGEDFAVFIDQRYSTLEPQVYASLPTLDDVDLQTFCDAVWCSNPSFDGSSPIVDDNSSDGDSSAGTAPGNGAPAEKILVSWNHVQVRYIQNVPENARTRVTLSLCQTTAQIDCEPVNYVQNAQARTTVQPVSQSYGQNVYELPYGYLSSYRLESITYASNDMWLNDPSLTP